MEMALTAILVLFVLTVALFSIFKPLKEEDVEEKEDTTPEKICTCEEYPEGCHFDNCPKITAD